MGKGFLMCQWKTKKKYTKKLWELDYEYFSKHYKPIAIDLSKQIELENPDLRQQINFTGKLEDDEATMFFTIEKLEETTFEFSQSFVSII